MVRKPKRSYQWTIRLSKEELSRIRRAAISNDEDVARFIRRAALTQVVKYEPNN